MTSNVKIRSEIDNKYKWDLTYLYKNNDEVLKDLDKVDNLSEELIKFKNKICKNSDNLYNFLEGQNKLSNLIFKIYFYTKIMCDVDLSNNENAQLFEKVKTKYVEINEMFSFVNPEILKENYEKIKKYIKENKKIEKYSFNLECLFKEKKHILNEKEEKIISSFSDILNSSSNVYNILTNLDFSFGKIKNEEDEFIDLTNSNYNVYIKSKDRNVRKNAYISLYKKYKENKNTISELYKNNIKLFSKDAKIRGYKDSLEKELYSQNIPVKVYDNLIELVNNNLNSIHKYYKFKKKLLKLENMYSYDMYVDIVNKEEKKYTFNEAKEIIINALKPLGDDYLNIVKKIFDEKWIDVYENKHKKSGAYSWSCLENHPIIFMNYQNDLNSVNTLIHEIGHAVHSYLSLKNQTTNNATYEIFVAEIASNVNELLLSEYLINKTKDIDEKKYLLNNIIDKFKGSMYRQTMFAEFERKIFKLIDNNLILTEEKISNLYNNLVLKYNGDIFEKDEYIKYEWMRIPHFYSPFYVYQYATGVAAAFTFSERILSNNENDIKDYIKFLSSGGNDYPLNQLKKAKIDMTDSREINKAFEKFNKVLEEFMSLY